MLVWCGLRFPRQDATTGETLFIVKWKSCPYDQCTQETKETLIEHGFSHLIDELDARTERINRKVAASMDPMAFRPITASPFDPYMETPFYMQQEVRPDPDSMGDGDDEDDDEEKKKEENGEGGNVGGNNVSCSKSEGGVEGGVGTPPVKGGNVSGIKEEQSDMTAASSSSLNIKTSGDEDTKKENGGVLSETDGMKKEKQERTHDLAFSSSGSSSSLKPEVKGEDQEKGGGKEGMKGNEAEMNDGASRNKDAHKKQRLREYQLFGVNWILSRLKRGVSVLLADEMGLGKTVQTIGVTGHLLFRENLLKPILIFAPQSTIDNWMREFSRWLPQANVVCFHGNAAAREIIKNYELQRVGQPRPGLSSSVFKFDVCVTTPSILNCSADAEYLRRFHWGLLVVDEAHQLKNINSKRFIELSLFVVDHKLFLSGTPLHNNLEELWNLLHFLNPSIHRDCAEFKSRYHLVENHAEVGEQKTAQLAALQAELNGFILRRVKKDVEKSMPKKVESILRVEMSPLQLKFYRLILTKNFDLLAKKAGGNRSSLQNICMELKKVCNHPFLCQPPDCEEDGDEWRRLLVDGSAKMGLLDKLLTRLKEKGHRVLIFSQMVKMLNLLADFLRIRGYKHQASTVRGCI